MAPRLKGQVAQDIDRDILTSSGILRGDGTNAQIVVRILDVDIGIGAVGRQASELKTGKVEAVGVDRAITINERCVIAYDFKSPVYVR